jgi:hypothetical protein
MNYNVLGTDYEIKLIKEEQIEDFPDLPEDSDGYCNYYTKEIVVVRDENESNGHDLYVSQVIRHELIHAYLFESGLHDYANNERIVDWLAIQLPKLAELNNIVGP